MVAMVVEAQGVVALEAGETVVVEVGGYGEVG